jgi:hypothetical protein
MPHPLNLVLKIKQDEESQKALISLKDSFNEHIQPAVDKALRNSNIVHFGRVLLIENKYLLVLTEYDGDRQEYTEFFRLQLPEVFKSIFALVEGAPSWDQLNNPDAFYKFAITANIKSLGVNSRTEDERDGYLFEAFGNVTVKEIREKL